MKQELFKHIAKNVVWNLTVNNEFKGQCRRNIDKCEDELPHGSGLDSGCKIDLLKSGKNKLVILFEFHHMDEWGSYDGWTTHELILKPDFTQGFSMRITGKDRNGIKDYLLQLFSNFLNERVEI